METMPNDQLRAHLPHPIITRLQYYWHRARGVRLAQTTTVFRGARLLRYPRNITLADNVIVKSGAHICPCNPEAKIAVGARTTIGFYSFLYASACIEIGDDAMIAPFVYIVDSDHGIDRATCMNRQKNRFAPIRIGNDVWIGAHAVILPGVTIADGAVVAAGAVVREDVASGVIVGGVPARVIGARK
jgi:acetyltransferase-like isoleucine patch superfamily enzyme